MRWPRICAPRGPTPSWPSWAERAVGRCFVPEADSAPPLAGRLIAVTRPAGQAASLCDAIRAAGGEALLFPVLAIAAVEDDGALAATIDRLDDFDLAFFVSPNAVEHALAAVRDRRSWPSRLAVATVGKGSERALAQVGFAHVIAPARGFDSESVLALPEFAESAMRGKRILIFRGDGGRDLLADVLRERGAEVVHVTCYRRYRPALDPAILLAPAARGELDALLLTSSEGVRNLAAMLGEADCERLHAVPVFAPHPRIAAHAREAGFATVIETEAGDDGLLRALVRHFG